MKIHCTSPHLASICLTAVSVVAMIMLNDLPHSRSLGMVDSYCPGLVKERMLDIGKFKHSKHSNSSKNNVHIEYDTK